MILTRRLGKSWAWLAGPDIMLMVAKTAAATHRTAVIASPWPGLRPENHRDAARLFGGHQNAITNGHDCKAMVRQPLLQRIESGRAKRHGRDAGNGRQQRARQH